MRVEPLNLHGFTVSGAMRRFAQAYNKALEAGQDTVLEVIHGKGTLDSGSAIRDTLRAYLKTQGKRISGFDAKLAMRGAAYLLDGCGRLAYMHGEDVDGNGGKTVVVPRQRLSTFRD